MSIPRRPLRQPFLTVIALILCCCCGSAPQAFAYDIEWSNPSLGNWFISDNWSVPIGFGFVPPNESGATHISNGGTALINSSSAVARSLSLGEFIGDFGIGGGGDGNLLITGGGTLRTESTSYLGFSSTLSTVTVGGNGSLWDANANFFGFDETGSIYLGVGTFGQVGSGSLRVESGGDVRSYDAAIAIGGSSIGSATVTGTGSTWTMDDAGMFTVGSEGAASLMVSDGGTVTNGTARIGYYAGSNGTATITGAGSFWNNSGNLDVGGSGGEQGIGTLRILDHGVVQAAHIKVSGTGSVEVSNGSSTTSGLIIRGHATPPPAGGTFGDLSVANSNSGRMLVFEGGTVASSTGQIGRGIGQVGTVTVDGAGSQWTNSGFLLVGRFGTASLDIRNGGKVSNAYGYIGNSSGSHGAVIVDGAGSEWTNTEELSVGENSVGALTIQNGGKVSDTAAHIGRLSAGSGTATVSGAGSTWNNSGTLDVGTPGGVLTSVLRIENDGTVNATETTIHGNGILELGANANLNSSLTINGGTVRCVDDATLTTDIALGDEGVTVITLGHNLTFGGNLSGTGGLTKSGIGMLGEGTLRLTGANTYAGPTVVTAGTLVVDGSITSTTTLSSGETLGGSGTVGPIDIQEGGTVSPGNSPGTLTAGNTVLEGGGNYVLELRSDGSGEAGTDWDSLAVEGSLDISALSESAPFVVRLQTLDGGNDSNPLDVWNPNANHTWSSVVSTTDGFIGDFDSSVFELDPSGFQSPINGTFSVVPDGTNFNLQYLAAAVHVGDYNGDGIVDAADYTVWRASIGQTGGSLAADGDGDFDVDDDDYIVWQTHFGQEVGSGAGISAIAAVPEPVNLVSLLTGMSVVFVRRRAAVS